MSTDRLIDSLTSGFSATQLICSHILKQPHVKKKKKRTLCLASSSFHPGTSDLATMFTTGETIRVNLSDHMK